MTEFRQNLKWVFIFAVVILISLFLIFLHRQTPDKAKTARIIRDGEILRTISLENVGEPYEFEVVSPEGGYNIVRVEDGKIAVTDADCPDRICVRRGFMENGTLPIVCLPHRLSVVILADGGADAVTGG